MPTALLQSVVHRLIPAVRTPGDLPAIELVQGQIDVGLCIMTPDGSRPVTQEHIEAWQAPLSELVQTGLHNLRNATSEFDLVPVDTVPGMQLYVSDDGQAASRLLCLGDLIRPWPMEGVVVAAPTPDQLMIVPLSSLAALQAIRVLLMAAHESHKRCPDALSDQLYWCDGETWRHVPVLHTADAVDVQPDASFVAALERLTAVHMVPEAAEA